MALINCKECNAQISSQAKACPQCGRPVPHVNAGDVGKVVGGLLLIWAAYSIWGGHSSDTAPAPAAGPAPVVTEAPTPAASVAPSFDCAKAHSRVEQLICSDASLMSSDGEYASLYDKAKKATSDKSAFVHSGRLELKQRDNCTDKRCLQSWYQARRTTLSDIVEHKEAAPAQDSESAPAAVAELPSLSAQVSGDGVTLQVKNNDTFQWSNCQGAINERYFHSGYLYRFGDVEPNQTVFLHVVDFAKPDGERFNPVNVKVQTFAIDCVTQKGKQFWGGDFN